MSKPKLGTKRIDPETGKKFYDLNRDPVISPYTGISYPLSYFESNNEIKEDDDLENEELDLGLEKPEFISLEDAENENKVHSDIPDISGDDVVDLEDDDTFLDDTDDDGDTEVSSLIGTASSANDDDEI